jgi:hypothetical protein
MPCRRTRGGVCAGRSGSRSPQRPSKAVTATAACASAIAARRSSPGRPFRLRVFPGRQGRPPHLCLRPRLGGSSVQSVAAIWSSARRTPQRLASIRLHWTIRHCSRRGCISSPRVGFRGSAPTTVCLSTLVTDRCCRLPSLRRRGDSEPGESANWRTIQALAAVAQWQSSRLVSGRSSVQSRPAAPTFNTRPDRPDSAPAPPGFAWLRVCE